MPKGTKVAKAESALKYSARKKGLTGKRANAYIFGTLNRIGLKKAPRQPGAARPGQAQSRYPLVDHREVLPAPSVRPGHRGVAPFPARFGGSPITQRQPRGWVRGIGSAICPRRIR